MLRAGKCLVAAALVVAGCAAPTGSSTRPASPSPVAVTLASGTFDVDLGGMTTIAIDATAAGDGASGELDVEMPEGGGFSVDLQCTRTTDTGILLIGGDVTDSTIDQANEESRAAIALEPGTPVKSVLWFEDQPANSCPAFLESIPDDEIGDFVQPVEGAIELGP